MSVSSAEAVLTAAKIGSLMAAYAAESTAAKFLIKNDVRRKHFFINNISKYSKIALKAMRFEVETVGFDPERFRNNNYLFVSNHLSYMDILCLSSVHPCIFVTSVDMGEAFFLGRMAEMGGSLFVERRHRGQIGRDLSTMSQTLKSGLDVIIYPEGTSTNGETVIPFKKSLLMSAVEAGVDLQPMTIKYTEVDGEPFSLENRDRICWYGDMSFAPHLSGVFKLSSVKVRLEFLEPIKVTPESTRQDLAQKAYDAILANYNDMPSKMDSINWKMAPESTSIA